jgi:putative ABC transport system permease protein
MRRIAEAIGPAVLVDRIRSGSDWLDGAVRTVVRRTTLSGILGGLGLALALAGVFGVTSYAVSRRTHEMGVRIALGAHPRQIVRSVVSESAWPVVIGIGVGLASAGAATRVIRSFLFETEPTDVSTFVVTAVGLATAALLAAWLPARRAARIDPVAALRSE